MRNDVTPLPSPAAVDAPLPPQRRAGSGAPLAAEFGDLAKRLVRRCFDRDQRAAVAALRLPWAGSDSLLDSESIGAMGTG